MTVKMLQLSYEKTRTLVLCAVLLTLLFSLVASNTLIILFLVLTIWKYPDTRFFFNQNKLGFLFILIFFFHVVSFLWTEDIDRYIKFLERNLSWVVFPVLLSVNLKKTIDLDLFKKIFFIGLVIFALINELTIVYDFLITTTHEKTARLFFSRYYQLSNAIRISSIHYTYLSMYNTIGLIFGLSIINKTDKQFLVAFGSLLLLFYNFQLGSRVFFALSLLFFVYACVIVFIKGNTYIRVFLMCVMAGLIWFAKPMFAHSYARFISRIEATFAPRAAPSEFYRSDRWRICVDLIQDNLFFGIGPADVERELQTKYRENNFKISVSEKYNSHNQYLDYTLRFGIFGGLLLLSVLWLICTNMYLNKKYDIMVIFLVFAIAMMTENYLSVQRGIVPFCVLSLLFYNSRKLSAKVD